MKSLNNFGGAAFDEDSRPKSPGDKIGFNRLCLLLRNDISLYIKIDSGSSFFFEK